MTIQTRYFDLDFPPEDSLPGPVSPIIFKNTPGIRIIPVVYIKKRVFERVSDDSIRSLAKAVYKLVSAISGSINQQAEGIQFDCDWTETTRDRYFLFLREYKSLSNGTVSCTVRLHQVKYPKVAGIPPVDYGVLMFYNMGEISAGEINSVYDRKTSEKYSPSLKTYPLPLDLALPIFSWALQLRNGHVIQLLNKMSFHHFENDSNFRKERNDRFMVVHSGFHGGYYFREADSVKVEKISKEDLFQIVDEVNTYSNREIRNLIFYDLDQKNIALYDENIYQELADQLH